MAIALVSGIFAVRLTWHYFAIITVVFSLIFYFFAVSVKPLTGGDDGINFCIAADVLIWRRHGKLQPTLISSTSSFWLTVSLCFYPHASRDPKVRSAKAFVAIRDNDVRAALIGLNVYQLRLVAFVMAGFLAGVSGVLFAFFGRYASASYMYYHVSGEACGMGNRRWRRNAVWTDRGNQLSSS